MKQTTRQLNLSRTRAMRTLSIGACLALSFSVAAQSDEPVRTLIDRSLSSQQIVLLDIEPAGLVYAENTGLVRSMPFSDITAMTMSHSTIVESPWLELTDGQRLTGTLISTSNSVDELFWTNPAFGTMRISLDDIKSFTLDPSIKTEQPNTADDWIALRNGDILTGFIEHVGDSIGIDTSAGIAQIPIDRLASAHFANDTTHRQGTFIWLADGTVARVATVRTTHTMIEATRPFANTDTEANQIAKQHIIPLSTLVAVVPDSASFYPLASLPLMRQTDSPQRRWTPPAHIGSQHSQPLGTAAIEIPGPMTLEWDLPDNSRLIAFDATLPERDRVWGDCEIIVHAQVAGKHVLIAQATLSGDHPHTSIHADFPEDSASLSITLTEGRFGPVQDEAILLNAMIITSR